jgi:hypothetical protein
MDLHPQLQASGMQQHRRKLDAKDGGVVQRRSRQTPPWSFDGRSSPRVLREIRMSAEKELLDRITQAMQRAPARHHRFAPVSLLPSSLPLTQVQARLELLAHRLQASRQPPPPPPPPPQHSAPNDSSLAAYSAMQDTLRQQRLALAVAQQRRDDLKREIERLSRQAETDAY